MSMIKLRLIYFPFDPKLELNLYYTLRAVFRWILGCSYNQGLPAVGRSWADVPGEGRRLR
jgi:hypothetical protein